MRSVFALATIVATVTAQAQNLTAALAGQPELTTLLSVLGKYPDLVTGLSAAKDITVVAPSNAAFAKFTNTTSANTTLANDALVKAILSYHILNGTIKSTAITTTPAFVPTKLVSPLLANVTGGQRVEALKTNDSVQIISGLMAASNVVKAVRIYLTIIIPR